MNVAVKEIAGLPGFLKGGYRGMCPIIFDINYAQQRVLTEPQRHRGAQAHIKK